MYVYIYVFVCACTNATVETVKLSDCSYSYNLFLQITLSLFCYLNSWLCLLTYTPMGVYVLQFVISFVKLFYSCCCLWERELCMCEFTMERSTIIICKSRPESERGRERRGIGSDDPAGWGQRDSLQAIKLVFLSLVLLIENWLLS